MLRVLVRCDSSCSHCLRIVADIPIGNTSVVVDLLNLLFVTIISTSVLCNLRNESHEQSIVLADVGCANISTFKL